MNSDKILGHERMESNRIHRELDEFPEKGIIISPTIKNMIKIHSEVTGLSFTIFNPNGIPLLRVNSHDDRIYTSIIESKEFIKKITSLHQEAHLSRSYSVKQINHHGLQFLFSLLRVKGKTFALLLCGPFIRNKILCEDPEAMTKLSQINGERIVAMDSSPCPIVREKELSLYRNIIKTSSEIIIQFYAGAIQNKRLHSSLQEKAVEFKTLYKISASISLVTDKKKVLNLVLDSAIGLLGAQNGSIMLLENETDELRIYVAYGLSDEIVRNTRVKVGEGISGNVAKTGKPRLLLQGVRESNGLSDRKKTEIKTAICVPLKVKGHVIGVLNVSGKDSGGNFSKKDVGLLEIMASNAAIAIYNANLYSKLEEKAGELEALYGIGTIITSSMEKKKVLHEVLRSAMRLLKAKKASFMTLDREKGELRIEIAYGLPLKIKKTVRPKIGEGIAGKVAMEGKPRLMEKGIKFSESKTEAREKEIPSAISVPVKVKENIIGVLNVSDKETGENFTKEEVDLLLMLANQAAIAIENSRLMEELQELFVQSITALANAIDARDPYTRGHSQRVTEYSLRIAKKMGIVKEDLDLIQYAALLHDIGKIHIRDDILLKPGKLTNEEFEEMQKHPAYGAKIMKPVKRFNTILPYMYHHHEKFAGKGYPFHLKGEDIPLAARIISVADSFDAMTSDRPYRKGLPVEEAIADLKRCSGSQFDPDVVETFLKILQQEKTTWLRQLHRKIMEERKFD